MPRAFSRRSNSMSRRDARRLVVGRIERGANGDGFLLHLLGRFHRRACAPHGCRESRQETPYRRRRSATCRSRRAPARHRAPAGPMPNTSSKPVTYWRAIRSRPAASRIASSRRTFGSSRTSCASADPRPPGEASDDRLEHRLRVVHVQCRRAPRRDCRADRRRLSAARASGAAEQDDAEIGVGADRLARRADRFEDAPARRGRPGSVSGAGRDAGAGRGTRRPTCGARRRRRARCRASAPRSRCRQASS